MKTYKLTLKNRPFFNILNRKKKWEGRLYRGQYKKVKIGDEFVFSNIEDKDEKRTLRVRITSIHVFASFEDAFTMIKTSEAIPGYSIKECLAIYYGYYPKETIRDGVVFFGTKLVEVSDRK